MLGLTFPVDDNAKITILGADGYPRITDHADAMQWSNLILATQDYDIMVLAGNGTALEYALRITVPPK